MLIIKITKEFCVLFYIKLTGMLFSRGITYYALIVTSAVVTLIEEVMSGRKNKKENGGISYDRIL